MPSDLAIIFTVFVVFVVGRWIFEGWLEKRFREIYLKKRKIHVERVERQAPIVEKLNTAGKSWRYDNDGVLIVG